MSKHSIELDARATAFVEAEIDAGRYGSADEVIEASLRLLEDRERHREWLRAELQKGVDSGIAENFSFDDVKRRGRERLAKLHDDAALGFRSSQS